VPVITEPHEFLTDDLFVDLRPSTGRALYLKCEGFNFAGSIKLKAAAEMIAGLERDNRIEPDTVLIESTSGNMGIALSMIAASKGLRLICVIDPRCNRAARRVMEAFGADVRMVDQPDPTGGGYLASRLTYVRTLCDDNPNYLWLNQYASPGNWGAHYRTTAPAIARAFPHLDVLFIGAGTAGTLMGCARYFRDRPRPPLLVAVDTVGSVTFGGPSAPRFIPGLGASVPPPQLDPRYIDDVVVVPEGHSVAACRDLAARGFLLGGSSGTVVHGALSWLASNDPAERLTSVAIAPDLGDRYLESVYDDGWVRDTYLPGEAAAALDPGRRLVTEAAALDRGRRLVSEAVPG
jgi:cysteine synthase A